MSAPVLTGERLLCVDTLLNCFLEQSLDPFCGERVGGSEGVKMIKGGGGASTSARFASSGCGKV